MAKARKLFTLAEANGMLPLVRSIVRDVRELADVMRERQERFAAALARQQSGTTDVYDEETLQAQNDLAREAAKMEEFLDELRKLGVELKGWDGLVDFPALMDGREVYLCWRYGEDEITHWLELDAGFAGRQKLTVDSAL
jgi:hypothetical protein